MERSPRYWEKWKERNGGREGYSNEKQQLQMQQSRKTLYLSAFHSALLVIT